MDSHSIKQCSTTLGLQLSTLHFFMFQIKTIKNISITILNFTNLIDFQSEIF